MNKVTVELSTVPDGRELRVRPRESQQTLSDDLALIVLRRELMTLVRNPPVSGAQVGVGTNHPFSPGPGRGTPIGTLTNFFGTRRGAKEVRGEGEGEGVRRGGPKHG